MADTTTRTAERQGILTDPAKAEAARDHTEDLLADVFSRVLRRYLARVEKAVQARLRAGGMVITAAGEPLDPITLGMLAGWWAETVDETVLAEVLAAWRRVYADAAEQIPESAVRTAVEDYMPRVRDRLVRGEVWIGGQQAPQVAEDSFDKARTILARSTALGWTRQETAARIALEFGWETNGPELRADLDQINDQINNLLDPLGHPGNPAREMARLNDPTIRELQAERAELIKALDAEKSYWQNRAQLIARTESTSLHGYAANRALQAEGFTHKQWVATNDARTRPEHVAADNQTVPVTDPFIVGGFTMQFPGDPAAPVGMIANCRCTMIGVDQDDDEPVGDEPTAGDGDGGGGNSVPPVADGDPDPGEDEYSRRRILPTDRSHTYTGPLGDVKDPANPPAPPSYADLARERLIAPGHDPDRYFTTEERSTARWLRAHGVDVLSVERRSGRRQRTPDAVIDGLPVTLETKNAKATVNAISKAIRSGRGQSRRVIVDLRSAGRAAQGIDLDAVFAQALRNYGARLDEVVFIIEETRSIGWSRG